MAPSRDALLGHPAFATLKASAREIMRDSPIVKIKVYDDSAHVLFSSDLTQVGDHDRDNPRYGRAILGEVVSALRKKRAFLRFEERVEGLDVVTTYAPIKGGDGETVIGVFELYSDVSPALADLRQTQFVLVAGVTVLLAALYGVLFLIVGRGDRLIRESHDLLQSAKERELELTREQFRALTEHSSNAIIVHRHFLPFYANKAAARIFGYETPQEILDQGDIMALVDERQKVIVRDFHESRLRGEQAPMEYEMLGRRKDGSPVWLENRSFRFELEDGSAICTTLFDITERKRLDDALKESLAQAELANRAKSEFLANMSHELRTPLNAIIGFSDAMLSELMGPLGNETYAEYVDNIHMSGQHLLELINDILDISVIEAGMLELEERDVDPSVAAEAALRLVRPRAEKNRIALHNDLPADLPRLIADERRVKQVLVNLLSNAVKFSPPDSKVTLAGRRDPDGAVVLEIIDNGVGMDEDGVNAALSRFGQVDTGLSRKYEGTGLGLPLSRELMEAHGGSLDITSAPGHGTRVSLRFPAERARPYGGERAPSAV